MNPADLPGRMAKHVRIDGECWVWTGARNSKGYACCTDGTGHSMLAHRRAYAHMVAEIPAELTIDHTCPNKVCVNPEHMEVVTRSENVRRAWRRRSAQSQAAYLARLHAARDAARAA